MTRDQYLKTKSALTHIDDALREGKLTPEQRAAFAALSVELSKQLVTTWFPAGWLRRSGMLSLLVVGGYGFLVEVELFIWCWLIMPIFSPRIMGDRFHSISRRDLSREGS